MPNCLEVSKCEAEAAQQGENQVSRLFSFFAPGKCGFISCTAFQIQIRAFFARCDGEGLTLLKLYEVSSRLCSALPMAASVSGCDGGACEARHLKRKQSEGHCGEQEIGVNELMLKYGRRSECAGGPGLAGRER